jgi:acetyl-CoA carboxylase biotin carboxyl carrier protein
MIDIKNLKELVQLMKENDLTELNIQDEKETVQLKRGGLNSVINHQPVIYNGGGPTIGSPAGLPMAYAPAGAPQAMSPQSAPAIAGGTPAAAATGTDPDAGLVAIESPMVGTYYASPSPDAKAFISEGSKITNDSVVCLIEAMKVFNEIKAEKSGTIARILVKNGQAVEFGQKLFLVKPA